MNLGTKTKEILGRTALIYKKFNSAIIVAGGNGTRAGTGNVTKQHCLLDGMPVAARTVDVFEKCGFINEIILVAKEDEIGLYDEYQLKYGWTKLVFVVPGGETRFQSVLNGFKKISDKSEFVYIHDAARCLITKEMIARVGYEACLSGCAIAACRPVDTCKHEDGGKIETVDRSRMWLAQTPQVFKTEIYRAAAYSADDVSSATDDSVLAEKLGFRVTPVDCGSENIKITLPIDFAFAKAILDSRGAGNE